MATSLSASQQEQKREGVQGAVEGKLVEAWGPVGGCGGVLGGLLEEQGQCVGHLQRMVQKLAAALSGPV